MKKTIVVLLTVMLLLSAVMCARAEDKEIRVAGNASVTLSADYATLQIGVTTKKDTVQSAQQENAQAMNAVLDALYAAGIEEKDVITSQFNIYSSVDWVNGEEKSYYCVDNMLSVTVRSLEKIGMVMDAAIGAGANQTYGIAFASAKENEAYLQALQRAVEDARAKAEVLAAAAGKQLGQLILMDASQGGYYYGISNTYNAKEAAAAGDAIVSGDVSVSASVVLTYEFQ